MMKSEHLLIPSRAPFPLTWILPSDFLFASCLSSDSTQEMASKKARSAPGTNVTADVGGSSDPGTTPGSSVGGGDVGGAATTSSIPAREAGGESVGGDTRNAPAPVIDLAGDDAADATPATGKNRALPPARDSGWFSVV